MSRFEGLDNGNNADTAPEVLKDGPLQKLARGKLAEYMAAMLGGNEKLCKALIPDYPVWTRRMTLGHGYLTAVTQPNVEVRREGIKRFLPEGIELDSGEILEADAIVCATGFETSFCPRFPLLGREENLQDTWAEGAVPKAYMSCAVAGLPNYFCKVTPITSQPNLASATTRDVLLTLFLCSLFWT